MPQPAAPMRDQPPVPGEELSVALALANTRLNGPNGPRDLLADPAQARAWLVERGLIEHSPVEHSPVEHSPVEHSPVEHSPVDAAQAASLAQLRESIRTLFRARIDAEADAGAHHVTDADDAGRTDTARPHTDEVAKAVAALNAVLAAAPCVTSLSWEGDGPRVTQRRHSREPFAQVLAALAADAAGLLAGPQAERLAACEAHKCIRLFIRTHAARHVCSTRCGDRVRAARHYARKRERERERAAESGRETEVPRQAIES